MHLVNPASGECEAVLKVPLRAAARESIVHESDVLAVMEDEFFTTAPSLLFSDRPRGIATQKFLPGTSGSRRFLSEYQDLLRALLLPDEHTTLAGQAISWQSHPLWETLDKPCLTALATALAEQSETTLLPACWVHGDFAPWNIRQAVRVAPRLIDWETGQRAALPLQDAFHFLHMQQFLFRRRPALFTAAVEALAKSVGISASLSRRLEIAYLARSYFSCLSWEEPQRADFLIKTLSIALREQRQCVFSGPTSRLRLISSRPARQQEARAEMLGLLTAELERQDIPYCILSGYEKTAAATGSDVDIMFRPSDLYRIPTVLARAGRAGGAALVQAIRHETSARYFVLARPEGKHVTHLALDVYGDYRRESQTWLPAEPLVARRRRYSEFFRPAVADEFIYRLTKKVLKQSLSTEQVRQLLHLFARDSAECQDRLAQRWPLPLATQIERALLRQDCDWLIGSLPELKRRLSSSRPIEGPIGRCTNALREALRLLTRIFQQTGFIVRITTEDRDSASELADRLMCNLAPAFGHVQVVRPASTIWQSSVQRLRTYAARIRSTLVIERDDTYSLSGVRRWFGRPDLTLQLESDVPPDRDRNHEWPLGDVVTFNADDLPDELVQKATATVLDRLAHRISVRLKLPSVRVQRQHPPKEIGAPAVEFESVGSD